MKDPNDHVTGDCIEAHAGKVAAPQGQHLPAAESRRPIKPFNYFQPFEIDAASSSSAGLPDCVQRRPVPGTITEGYFVPVSFVAGDWNVTPRRIRALLSAGRLAGRVQPNGYWEVRYPYLFALGTRGPSLKRQKRPPKRPRLVVDNTERSPE